VRLGRVLAPWAAALALMCSVGGAAAQAPREPQAAPAAPHADPAASAARPGAAPDAAGATAQAAAADPAALLKQAEDEVAAQRARHGERHPAFAAALNSLGELQRELGLLREALATQRRTLALAEAIAGPDHLDTAAVAGNLGLVHQALGDSAQALALFERALSIRERQLPGDHLDIANSLNSLAEHHRQTAAPERALPLYERALAIVDRQLGPDHGIAALIVGSRAAVLLTLGRLDEALAAAERSVAIREKLFAPAHPQLALGLNLLGEVQRALGQDDRALALMQRALEMVVATLGPEHPEVAMALNNLAGFHDDRGRHAEALPLYRRSLAIVEARLGAEHALAGASLANIGAAELALGRTGDALASLKRSVQIRARRLGPDHLEVAYSLHNLALAQAQTGDGDAALRTLERAITVVQAHAPAARDLLAACFSQFGVLHARAGRGDLGVLWGKEAVNVLQDLRAGLRELDRGLQAGFAQRQRGAYDRLAEMLIAQGRIAEAQDVLQMLKEAELHEDLRRAGSPDPRSTRIELTGVERSRFARYYELRDRQAEVAAERQAVEARLRAGAAGPGDAARLKQIVDELQPAAAGAMQAFFGQLEADLRGLTATGTLPAGAQASRLRQAVDTLAREEPDARAVGLQYLVTDDRVSIVLTLPGAPPLAHQRELPRRELYARIAAVLEQLRHPRTDPALLHAGLHELHRWLVAPVEADLRRFGARTLMLSLDDQLRLLPFAALRDAAGRHLVQDYTLALYNEAARQALQRPDAGAWRIAAMGLSEAVDDLPALPAVPGELAAVVTVADGGGPARGEAYLNAAFDGARLRRTLATAAAGPGDAGAAFNVLHIASHFVFQAGAAAQSRLYLGDKTRLTLADIAREDLRFGRFELVALSACDTARAGGRDADGRELESLGAKAQNQGARAVLATLWKVADASTAPLMRRFYAARAEGRFNKAQALRDAQLALLEGRIKPPGAGDWRAPFHWAGFVLMGNWR
jgi:CHAT domain-containing protein